MQQLQWLHFTATLSISSECVPFAKHRNGFLLQLTWGEAALTIIRARPALHPLTGIALCLQSNQTDAHFFWKVDMSETEPLANALKLHFHLLLWSMFLLFRRKLFWILFRGCVSSEWAFTFLLFLPNDLTHHSTRYSPLTSGEVTEIVLSVFSMSESICFLRCEASARRWLHLSLVVSLVHQSLFSLVLLGIRIITLFSRGFRIAASYCIIECFVEGEGEPWSENVRSQSGKAVGKSPELKRSTQSFLGAVNQLPGKSVHVPGSHYELPKRGHLDSRISKACSSSNALTLFLSRQQESPEKAESLKTHVCSEDIIWDFPYCPYRYMKEWKI